MSDSLHKRIGAVVEKGRGAGPQNAHPDAQRRAFMEQVAKGSAVRSGWPLVLLPAAGLLLVTIAFVWWHSETTAPPLAPSRLSSPSGASDGPVASVTEREILFDNGTRYRLETGAAARVAKSGPAQVVVLLDNGRMHCAVNGNGRTRWVVAAGDYRVMVTGTRFDVTWQPGIRQLKVGVQKGSVQVLGGAVGRLGVTLLAGDQLVAAGKDVRVSSRTKVSRTDPLPGRSAVEAVESDVVPVKERGTRRLTKPVATSKITQSENWKTRYLARDYTGAVQLAKQVGLTQLIEQASADDLSALGKAARYAGDGVTATAVLEGIAKRFAGTNAAYQATFMLGRVALELGNDKKAARDYFEKLQKGAPDGPLADKAMGRLIEIYRDTGDIMAARATAKRYLLRFPQGTFATVARSVLK